MDISFLFKQGVVVKKK